MYYSVVVIILSIDLATKRLISQGSLESSDIIPKSVYIPRTPMTSIFEGSTLQTRPLPIKRRVIWVLGIQFVRKCCDSKYFDSD